jgi:hypothetical protein
MALLRVGNLFGSGLLMIVRENCSLRVTGSVFVALASMVHAQNASHAQDDPYAPTYRSYTQPSRANGVVGAVPGLTGRFDNLAVAAEDNGIKQLAAAQESPTGRIIPIHQSPDIADIPNPTPVESTPGQHTTGLPEGMLLDAPLQYSPEAASPLFKRLTSRVTATWLPGSGDDLGIFDIDLRGSFAASRLSGLTITPGFQTHFLDGPLRTDMPGQLHNVRTEFSYKRQLSQRLGSEIAVSPGWYSDFESSNSDALRIISRVLGFYALSQQTQFAFGVLYLDREDISLLPAAGLIHVPNESTRIELIFPKPRLAKLVRRGPCSQQWVYLGGEFGGGSWAVARTSGLKDVATYSDLRLIVGVETKNDGGATWLVEAAYVFARELEYRSGLGDFDPSDTAMVRAGVTF